METLGKLRKEGDRIYIAGKAIEPLFSAIARDDRSFHMTNAGEVWEKLQLQVHVEQSFTNGIGPQLSPAKVTSEYRVSLGPYMMSETDIRLGSKREDGIQLGRQWPLRSAELFLLHESQLIILILGIPTLRPRQIRRCMSSNAPQYCRRRSDRSRVPYLEYTRS
jgi:hypothetical protein